MADEPKKEAPKLKGQAIIEDLKVKLKEIDKQADVVIKDIAQQAENYKADPSSISGRVDVSKLEEILQRADSLIYDPKVAEVLDDASSAKAVKYIVSGLHDKVRRSIQHDLVEKYPDLKLGISGHTADGVGTTYRKDPSKEETFGGVFSEFVVKNIDESRLNYETKRLSLIKAIPHYAKEKQDAEYKGIGQDFQDIKAVAQNEKENLDLIFGRMASHKPEDIATMLEEVKKSHFSAIEVSGAYRVFLAYATTLVKTSELAKQDPAKFEADRRKAIETILNGNPEFEKEVSPELLKVVRALSVQFAYAYSLDPTGPDKKLRADLLKRMNLEKGFADEDELLNLATKVNGVISDDLALKGGDLQAARNRAMIARIKELPHVSNTILKLFPEYARTLEQMQAQASTEGIGEAFFKYSESFVARYENKEFDSIIEEADHYAEAYEKLDEMAATPLPDGTTPENGDQVFKKMADQQQGIVNRQIDTLARRRRYKAAQEHISALAIKKSDTELDLEKLGKAYGVKLTGSINYKSEDKDYLKEAKGYNEATSNGKKFMREELLDKLSTNNYEALREKAIADMQAGPENKLLAPQPTIMGRLRDLFVTSIGRFFRIRNINTNRERNINEYIRSHYLGPMLAENAAIQKDHDMVAELGPKIKEDDIYFRDVDRARATKNKEREADKAKSKTEPTKPAKPDGERT